MDHLWTPWRKAYLRGETAPRNGCLFCSVLKEEDDESNLVVHRGASVFAMLNRYPYSNGHLLLIPKEHVSSLEEVSLESLTELMALTQAVLRALREAYAPEGFNMGVNIGAAAGAGIPDHVHAHILPRWVGDTNFMTTVAQTHIIPEELNVTYARMKELLAKFI